MPYTKIFITIIVSFILVLLFCSNCGESSNPTEPVGDKALVGSWDVIEMSWNSPGDSGSYNESQLDSMDFVWTLTFNNENSASQQTNISGALTIQNGKWSTANGNLTVTLQAPSSSQTGTIVFSYSINGNILNLAWTVGGTNQMSAKMRKQ